VTSQPAVPPGGRAANSCPRPWSCQHCFSPVIPRNQTLGRKTSERPKPRPRPASAPKSPGGRVADRTVQSGRSEPMCTWRWSTSRKNFVESMGTGWGSWSVKPRGPGSVQGAREVASAGVWGPAGCDNRSRGCRSGRVWPDRDDRDRLAARPGRSRPERHGPAARPWRRSRTSSEVTTRPDDPGSSCTPNRAWATHVTPSWSCSGRSEWRLVNQGPRVGRRGRKRAAG
jgi:hypothetical protein